MEHVQMLERYAKLIVSHGLNVQVGQQVNVAGEVCHRDLAYSIAEAAYQRGASYVHIDLIEPRALVARISHAAAETHSIVPGWVSAKFDEMVDRGAAGVSIVGMEDPLLYSKLDPRAMNVVRMAQYAARRRYYDEGIGRSKVHWCVVAGATEGWARRLFPRLDSSAATTALWKQIFSICRLEHDDFLERWAAHNRVLHSRARALTEMGIRHLRFRGPGTDLQVGLSRSAVFKGGGEVGPYGVEFEPNLPTEECFTTPDWRETAGTVKATRPFLINGVLIEGLTMNFVRGEIVDFRAKTGEETFREYIASDPGACRLGEVALVGTDSPVFRSGLVFEEILFDENAACHIAVGSAYKFCLQNGASLSAQELLEVGCNDSSVHTDMMISSEEVDVDAILWSGEVRALLRSGSFVTQ